MLQIRRPAHAGLIPSQIEWKKASSLEIEVISQFFDDDISNQLEKKDDYTQEPIIGYYRVLGKDSVFMKVLNNSETEYRHNGESISAWLKEKGIKTNPVRSGLPLVLPNRDMEIYIYDYVDYISPVLDANQLSIIGEELGKMHALLKQYPRKDNVENAGRDRNKLIRDRLREIKETKWRCLVNPSVNTIIAEVTEVDIRLLEEHPQMIHGDLNYGNLLIDRNTYEPIFIDFEDSSCSWISPLYDIAFVFQRFIFNHEHVDVEECITSFVEGYRLSNRIKEYSNDDVLYVTYKMIAVRAILLLSLLHDDEQALYEDEYKKFVWLYHDAVFKKPMIDAAYSMLLA